MRIIHFVLALVALIVAQKAEATPVPSIDRVAIVGADVLPMTGQQRLDDQTVLIEDGRIERLGPRNSFSVPEGFLVVDAAGMTLMPGLVDMHIHLAPAPAAPGDPAQRALAVMLAHGVTTARTMAGAPQHLEVRAAIEDGRVAGPRLYAAAPGVNISNTHSAEEAEAAVEAAAAAGYDLIKSHHIEDVAVWTALQDRAAELGLPTAGHVANPIGLFRALEARQQVEHLDGVLFELLDANAPERAIPFAQIPPPQIITALSSVDQASLVALARRVAASETHHVPTLALFEKIVDPSLTAEVLSQSADMRFVPAQAVAQWTAQRQQSGAMGYTPEVARQFIDLRRRLTLAFHEAGTPLMTGSDTAQDFHIWGPGLIEEIEALANAGLSNLEALRAATVVPRDYFRSLPNSGSALGWEPTFGTVEPGARADLILVEGDPSVDLSALRRLQAVFAGGRHYDRLALDRLLAEAAAAARPELAVASPAHPIYVMRHLEVQSGSDDPPLSADGAAVAGQLVEAFADADIQAIFVTPTRRSRDSAAPLAARLDLQPETYDPSRPHEVVSRIRSLSGPALVFGHSNTVPDLVARLGGGPVSPLAEDAFNQVWRLEQGAEVVECRPEPSTPGTPGSRIVDVTRCGESH